MQQQEQQRAAPHNQELEVTSAHEAETAIEQHQQPTAEAMPPAASFGALTGQREAPAPAAAAQQQAEPAKDQPIATDAVIEQLAHGMVAKELDDKDEKFLSDHGYRAMPIIRGKHEFVMRTFLPTQGSGKAPIVAFRGTVPTKIETVIADLDPSGIGMYQFNPNRSLIEGQMQLAAAHGKVISSGHSLGGALAQIAAATFPDCVGRIVTFQAPGVERETAQKLVEHNEKHPDEAIDSTHHRVKNDLVPMGGEALTPGTVHNHQMVGGSMLGRNPLAAHLVLPLAQEEVAKGNDVPIHNDQGVVATDSVSTEQENADKSQLTEMARTGLGHLVYGTGAVINGIGNAFKKIFH